MSDTGAHLPSPFSAALRDAATHVRDGTHQADRAPDALRADQFAVDDFSFEQRVAMAARLAGQLQLHHGVAGRAPAHWAGLFDGDEALLLARIAAEARLATQDLARCDLQAIALPDLAARCDRLADQLMRWRSALERVEGDGALVLLRAINDLHQRAAAAGLLPGQAATGASAATPETAPGDAQRQALRNRLDRLNAVLLRLQGLAQQHLGASLRSGRHEPAAALLAGFFQLLGTVQQHINRFSERHADFYLQQVLRMQPRPARPDQVHLVLQRDQRSSRPLQVPAGTAFAAGKDASGAEIVFRADRALQVTDAQVQRLGTLRFERDPLISPEHELGYVNRAQALMLDAPPAQAPTGPGAAARPAVGWPPMGGSGQAGAAGPALIGHEQAATQGPVGPQATPHDARLGLAIASPLLLLQEGERQVQITLRLSQAALVDARIQGLVALHAAAPAPDEGRLAAVFEAFAQQDRQRAPAGSCSAEALARVCSAPFARWPAAQRDVRRYFRGFLLQRALLSRGEGFRHAAGQLFAHWLLSHHGQRDPFSGEVEPDDWLSADEHRALKAVAAQELGPSAESWSGGVQALRAQRREGEGDGSGADGSADGSDGGPGPGDPLSFLLGPAGVWPDRDLVFARLFTGMFALSYSGPNGWHEVADAHVIRPDEPGQRGSARLQVVMRLGRGDPPVLGCSPALHGEGWHTRSPVLRLRLKAFGGLYPCSMLESALLMDVHLAVQVQGLRQLSLQNQLGRLDPSKPFQPFGPLPTRGSYLVLGSAEMAGKPLTALRLNLQWGGLPADAGGMDAHYQAYPSGPDNRSFGVSLAVLRDGQWQSQTSAGSGAPQSVPLLAADAASGPLEACSQLQFDGDLLRHQVQPVPGSVQPAVFDLSARQGFVRVQLVRPDAAFGHADYPLLLTQAVSGNAHKRRGAQALQALPRPPYTPLLEGLSVDYAAERLIVVGGPAMPASDEHLIHLHPFGLQPMHPRPEAGPCHLLPRYRHDGQLFIGLRAPGLPPRITLLFDLNEEQAVVRRGPMPPLHWAVLAGDQWLPLPQRHLLSDGTQGLLCTGIVELDLPEAMDSRHAVMPDGLYWLALSADEGFERFAALRAVHANALCATRVLDPAAAPVQALPVPMAAGRVLDAPLPAGRVLDVPLPAGRVQVPPLPGLVAVAQPAPSFGASGAESTAQMRVRVGERLRHKQRATLAWDIERLVLQHFPQVCKVKCFAAGEVPALQGSAPAVEAGRPGAPATAAGQVMVAVVAAPDRFDRATGRLWPRLNAIELEQIARLLRRLSSPFASIEVRNAAQERVQVCTWVRLQPGLPVGSTLQAVDRCIFDFLSPWCEGGLGPRFGWVVRAEDIEARVRECVPGVVFMTGLSMLHIAESDDGYHQLGDTAQAARAAAAARDAPLLQVAEGADDRSVPPLRPQAPPATAVHHEARVELRPLLPWSIAVPMPQHTIRLLPADQPVPARASGIADLAVGSNLIIGGAEHG